MKKIIISLLALGMVPVAFSAFAADSGTSGRTADSVVTRAGAARGAASNTTLKAADTAARVTMVANLIAPAVSAPAPATDTATQPASDIDKAMINIATATSSDTTATDTTSTDTAQNSDTCRTAYRDCMDQFCLLDPTEGSRCTCSDNISQAKPLIQKVMDTQKQAADLATTGVEREQYGASADYVFGASDKAKATGIDYSAWLSGGSSSAALDADDQIGQNLYGMAQNSCASRLAACGSDADMEELLYSRMIANDCKAFNSYLADQQATADSNLALAQQQVRATRYDMKDITNKYNAGECLMAYEGCVQDKGGCGEHYENCLDAKLLARRADACSNILDQCTATADYVKSQWDVETKTILADAAKYADTNKRATCLSQINACLEDSCSITTSADCLTNINVAAGICPIINDCNSMIPGLKTVVQGNLGYIRTRFCQDDVSKCLQEKCGADYSNPACLNQDSESIVDMCPQDMFPSCKNEEFYDQVLSATMMQVDYQMLQGCLNYYATAVNKACGADMVSCVPDMQDITNATSIAELQKLNVADSDGVTKIKDYADSQADAFFKQISKDPTAEQCSGNADKDVFLQTQLVGKIQAENRVRRQYLDKMAELSRAADIATAKQTCDDTFTERKKGDTSGSITDSAYAKKAGTWTTSHTFEEDLRNCKICQTQRVCATGGLSKSSALGGAGAMMAGGAGAGMAAGGPWGALIGGVAGGAVGLFSGLKNSGKETVCQDIESCDNTAM